MNKKTFKKSFIDSLPVLAGYTIMGMGFGILLNAQGYSFWWASLMGLTILSGSMQYVTVDLLSGGASFITSAIMTLVINARYFFYGLSMVGKYSKVKRGKWYLIFALTDETYSLAATFDETKPENKGVSKKGYYFALSILNHCYWIVGCTLGAILGEVAHFDSKGMEFAMTALFITIFVDQWFDNKDHFPALFGVGISIVCLLIFGADGFVIPAMVILTMTMLFKPAKKEKEEGGEITNG